MTRTNDGRANEGLTTETSNGGGLYDGFESYRTATEADYRSLFADGIIVPDTNVFLNLYRYNEQTRNDLLSVMKGLGERLWVPRQVMSEFWRARERVLLDPRDTEKTVAELSGQRDRTTSMLHSWISRVGLPQEHKEHFDDIVSRAFDELIEDVKRFADNDAAEFAKDTNRDPVLAELESILKGRVGPALSGSSLQDALREAKRRADAKIPPGYKDAAKPGERSAGDYLIWDQILSEVRARPRDILIITGDVKEDWWRREHGELRGPRTELAYEANEAAGVRLFMLRPESLLVLAGRILRIHVRDESVEDIERVDTYLSKPQNSFLAEIREAWPDILEEVKKRRRVAWMLLSNASVAGLDEDVLTLKFPRKGDVKGWLSSGYDQMLWEIIKDMFDVELRFAAVSSTRRTVLIRGDGSNGLIRQEGSSGENGIYSDEPPF